MNFPKRKVVTIQEVREYFKENPDSYTFDQDVDKLGFMALLDVENMGLCKDGCTKWYMFDFKGEPCIGFKHSLPADPNKPINFTIM